MTSDILHQLAPEIAGGGEDAPGDHVTLDFGEPDLDLVEPGAVGGREMEMHVRVFTQPLLHGRGLVGRLVVQDHVDFEILRLTRDEVPDKREELAAGVAFRGAAFDPSSGYLEGPSENK
jgi:hypothetical protein